jgi:hypothetical protein
MVSARFKYSGCVEWAVDIHRLRIVNGVSDIARHCVELTL